LNPDVFVVDEALAVGDAGFQAKCVERMTKLVAEGKTLMFVSHDLRAVEALCDRAVFLHHGKIAYGGPARSALRQYLEWVESHRLELLEGQSKTGPVHVQAASCHDLDGNEVYRFKPGEGLEIRLRFESDRPLERPHVNLGITDGRAGLLVQCSMLTDGQAPARVGRMWEARCRIKQLPLRPRLYQVYCDVYGSMGHGTLMDWMQVSAFRIASELDPGPIAVVNAARAGAVDVPYEWIISSD